MAPRCSEWRARRAGAKGTIGAAIISGRPTGPAIPDRGQKAELGYHWSATTGSFNSATVAEPVLTCTSAGPATVTASVEDGDPNPICAGTLAIQVSCVSPSP